MEVRQDQAIGIDSKAGTRTRRRSNLDHRRSVLPREFCGIQTARRAGRIRLRWDQAGKLFNLLDSARGAGAARVGIEDGLIGVALSLTAHRLQLRRGKRPFRAAVNSDEYIALGRLLRHELKDSLGFLGEQLAAGVAAP